ncbi:ABC transporter ATP-binding protein [Leucobacter aridicollis]|uniref:ABC transporter ATP-binding protein n=1 Tax=Leucobacter aridicollis TaxID=283878 RepID=UPI00216885DF|nr:ABC transporter ATP-binding protein [Leucobacter aridicollis]MCS3426433.1 putative ABC transport system ATP-binding protein [Leucobacter aridicollis]
MDNTTHDEHRDMAIARTWLIQAKGANKAFGTTLALADASVSITPGESVAIMGPSGSGKSTLLYVLAGILTPDSGAVLVRRSEGTGFDDLATLSDDARSAFRLRRFGFVFQQGMLLPELTAAENIALPLLLMGVSRTTAEERAERELRRLGLEGLGQRRIGQLSGGQSQRVAIARALVNSPSVIFADEPTGSLDSRSAAGVLDVLLEKGTRLDGALVIVTHDTHVASQCDRIIHLRDGQIVSNV